MKKLLFISMLCISLATFAQPLDWNKTLPQDSKTIVGKLKNGMTYYIRHNEEPKQRASFYIIRNAGALLENDDQNGLAHFLEHMAFNGSKNFPGNSMIATLERHGISFGGNLNAYTTQNETVYNISDAPCTDEAVIDTCLLVLHDWSCYLTLADKDLDDERGVITEEWRTRRNSAARIREQQNKVLLKDSKYAERDVIGTLEVINHFQPQVIRDFYHQWYRTDLEAIAVVGDFDVVKMEKKIKKLFSKIPAVKNPSPRPFYELPGHEATYFACSTDKEATKSSVNVIRFWRDKDDDGVLTYQEIKDGLLQTLFNAMASARINEKIQQGNAPYLSAYLGAGEFIRGYEAYQVYAVAKPNQEKEALTGILQDQEALLQHGFTDSELSRMKTNILANLESMLKSIDKTSNESHMNDIKDHFLQQSALVPFEDYYNAVKEILPTITAQEVADQLKKWWQADNRCILINGPSEGVTHLTEAEAREIVATVSGQQVAAYEDQAVGGSLISQELPGSPIVAEKELPEFEAKEWTLANGAKVVFRAVDYDKEDVSLYAYSAGGTSLYDVDQLVPATNASNLVAAYGLGDYDAVSLNKLLTGKKASASASIGQLYETVSGKAIPQDVETMLQMVYLRFEQPRFDSITHKVMLDRMRINLQQTKGQPNQIMSDSIKLIFSNYHPRTILMDEQKLDQLTLENIEKVYRDRIQDASDFIFFLVGNIDEATAKPLVEKYIGSIRSTNRHEAWVDRQIRRPKGRTEKVIELPLETPKSTVLITLSKEMPYDLKEVYSLNVLSAILDMRYTENIREKEGGTYGVSVNPTVSREPINLYSLGFYFDCQPDRVDDLKPLIYVELEKVQQSGVTEEEMNKVVKNMLKEREQVKHHNSFWMNVLSTYYMTGVDTANPANCEEIVSALTTADIQNFAKKFLKDADVIDVKFIPNKK